MSFFSCEKILPSKAAATTLACVETYLSVVGLRVFSSRKALCLSCHWDNASVNLNYVDVGIRLHSLSSSMEASNFGLLVR